jgi:antitoxin HicB
MERTKDHRTSEERQEILLHETEAKERSMPFAVKRMIAGQLDQAMRQQGMSKTEMAARMQTSRKQLDRVLNPNDGNVTLETLRRAANAVGRNLRFELT